MSTLQIHILKQRIEVTEKYLCDLKAQLWVEQKKAEGWVEVYIPASLEDEPERFLFSPKVPQWVIEAARKGKTFVPVWFDLDNSDYFDLKDGHFHCEV